MKRLMLSCWIASAAVLASGCFLSSRVDEEWGAATEDNRAAQVADPAGAGAPEGPQGLGAVTAEEIAERYYRDQATQPTRSPAPVLQD